MLPAAWKCRHLPLTHHHPRLHGTADLGSLILRRHFGDAAPSSTRTQISLLGTATLFRAALSPVGSSTQSQTSAPCPVPDPLPVSTARLASGSLSNSSGEDDRQGCAAVKSRHLGRPPPLGTPRCRHSTVCSLTLPNPLLLPMCLAADFTLTMEPLRLMFAAICLPMLLASTVASADAVNPGCERSCRQTVQLPVAWPLPPHHSTNHCGQPWLCSISESHSHAHHERRACTCTSQSPCILRQSTAPPCAARRDLWP